MLVSREGSFFVCRKVFLGIYARSGRFMRVREDLCVFGEIYARHEDIHPSWESSSFNNNSYFPTSLAEFGQKRFIFITIVENERVFMNCDELYLRKIHFVKGGFKWKKH